jgi:bifunctional enzyme CysN/CysC
MPWFTGPTMLDAMTRLTRSAAGLGAKPLRLPIQDVYRFDGRRILAGRLESGRLTVGDNLLFLPGGKQSATLSSRADVGVLRDRR